MDNKKILLVTGAAALSLGLIALPGISRSAQDAGQVAAQKPTPPAAPAAPRAITRMKIMQSPEAGVGGGTPDGGDEEQIVMSLADRRGSWLGVETTEVTAERAK